MPQRSHEVARDVRDPESVIRPGVQPRVAFRRALVAARLAAGLTQADLASRLGTTQSAVARLESGGSSPTIETLCRLADVLRICFEVAPQVGLTAHPLEQPGLTLDDLRARRDDILRIAAAHGAQNVRVFGSVARGDAGPGSDVDFLVDIVADAPGFEYFGLLEDLRRALEESLDRDVNVVDSAGLRGMRERVLRDALSL
jgi:transcriptional regulator with XRE-family HTH domain